MPAYFGSLQLATRSVVPGGRLEGQVEYTISQECTLKGAELRLECQARYIHQGTKKYPLDVPSINIDLFHRDGRRVGDRERLTERTVFQFQTTLPTDLLPTTEGRTRAVLEVAYTLRLTSKRGWLRRRNTDTSTPVTMLSVLDNPGQPFSEMGQGATEVKDSRFGQGFDMVAAVRLSSFVWSRGDRMEVTLEADMLSSTHSHTVSASLERTVRYRDKSTSTDVTTSRTARLPSHTDPPGVWRRVTEGDLVVDIPADTPLSGVLTCSTLSVQYRLRVDIKVTSNDLPTFTIAVPIVIAARPRRRKTKVSSGLEPDPKAELRGPRSAQPGGGMDSCREAGSVEPPSPPGHTSSHRPSARSPPVPVAPRPSRQDPCPSGEATRSYTSAGTQTCASVTTQTSLQSSGDAQDSPGSGSDRQREPGSRARQDLLVVNPSSRATSSFPQNMALTSSGFSDLSLGSSGPQAMSAGPDLGAARADHPNRGEVGAPPPAQRHPGFWQVPPVYHYTAGTPLLFQNPPPPPPQAQYGATADFSETDRKNYWERTASPNPGAQYGQYGSDTGSFAGSNRLKRPRTSSTQ